METAPAPWVGAATPEAAAAAQRAVAAAAAAVDAATEAVAAATEAIVGVAEAMSAPATAAPHGPLCSPMAAARPGSLPGGSGSGGTARKRLIKLLVPQRTRLAGTAGA